jgi:hypothetical protein
MISFRSSRPRIVERRTRTPYLALGDRALAAAHILHHEILEPLEDALAEMERILFTETMPMEDADLDGPPTWRATVFATPLAGHTHRRWPPCRARRSTRPHT